MMDDGLFKKEDLFNCANSIESLKCFQCSNFDTYKLLDLRQHLKAGHLLSLSKEKLYECEACNFKSYSNFLYLKHNRFNLCFRNCNLKSEVGVPEKGVDYFQCEYCLFNTPLKSVFKDHVQKGHKLPKRYKCEYCLYTTKDITEFKGHILVRHTDPAKIQWFKCEQCSYKGKTERYLKHHMRYYHEKAKIKCAYCPFVTTLKNVLKRHNLVKHTDPDQIKWFECKHCSYKSKMKSLLTSHVNHKHVKVEKLKCDQCSFYTKFKEGLKLHILMKHTDPDKISWSNCEHCSYKCKRKNNLKRHMDTKHGEKEKLKCKHCQFETKFEKNMKRHNQAKHPSGQNL